MIKTSTVQFDVNNAEHRLDAFVLINYRGFSRCKHRYNLEGNYGDVTSMIQDRISRYYLDQEFRDVSVSSM